MRKDKNVKVNLEKRSSATDICKKFLQDMDKYIARNWRNFKGCDIYSLYLQLYDDLKEFIGNSNGFTGFTEFLIFRLLYYQLGGKFERQEINKHSSEFIYKSDNEFSISQGISKKILGRRYKPDIAICYKGKIIANVEIKAELKDGVKTVKGVMKTFERIRHSNKNMYAVLLIFRRPDSKAKRLLEKERKNKKWFNFIILEKNKKFLWKELKKSLNLKNKIR